MYRTDLDQNDKSVLFHCLIKLNGREEVLDKFCTTQDAKDDYEGSQLHLKNVCCAGASHPFGVI